MPDPVIPATPPVDPPVVPEPKPAIEVSVLDADLNFQGDWRNQAIRDGKLSADVAASKSLDNVSGLYDMVTQYVNGQALVGRRVETSIDDMIDKVTDDQLKKMEDVRGAIRTAEGFNRTVLDGVSNRNQTLENSFYNWAATKGLRQGDVDEFLTSYHTDVIPQAIKEIETAQAAAEAEREQHYAAKMGGEFSANMTRIENILDLYSGIPVDDAGVARKAQLINHIKNDEILTDVMLKIAGKHTQDLGVPKSPTDTGANTLVGVEREMDEIRNNNTLTFHQRQKLMSPLISKKIQLKNKK